MNHVPALVVSLLLAGCRSNDVRREVFVHEQALLLPESLTAAEPRADRVTILQASGRTLVFEDVVIGREEGELVVRGLGDPVRVPLADARAVQLDRQLVGADRRRLIAEDQAPPDVVVTPGWGIVLGVLGTLAAVIIAVNELDPND